MPKITPNIPAHKVAEELARYFHRNGYVRYQNPQRLSRESWRNYKKGDELRLCAHTAKELAEMRRLLKAVGFKPGRAFLKHGKRCQPVYGRDAVRRFLALVGAKAGAEAGDAVKER